MSSGKLPIARRNKNVSEETLPSTDRTPVYNNLDADIPLEDQKFYVISIFTPNSVKTADGCTIRSHNVRALKMRGSYKTYDEALARIDELKETDDQYPMFIAPVGVWVPWNDDAKCAEEAVHGNEELNEMMGQYKAERKKASDYMESRIKAVKTEAEQERQAKLAEKVSTELTSDDIELKIREEGEQVENLTNEVREIEHEIEGAQEQVSTIDEELARAMELHKNLMNQHVKSGKDISEYVANMIPK